MSKTLLAKKKKKKSHAAFKEPLKKEMLRLDVLIHFSEVCLPRNCHVLNSVFDFLLKWISYIFLYKASKA